MKVHVTHADKSKLHSEISCEQRKTQPLSTGEAVKIDLEPRAENCLHCQKRKKKTCGEWTQPQRKLERDEAQVLVPGSIWAYIPSRF